MIDHSNLEEFDDAVTYDVENTLDEEGDFIVAAAARYGGPVLDLACGTGRLTIPIAARGLRCVGVDLAPKMIAHARAKSIGLPIEYLEADCRTLDLAERFGFALMTGHAYQALLTDDDQRAFLAVVARHLRPGGGLVFETRNPAPREDLVPEERIAWERSYQDATGAWLDAHVVTRFDPETALQHCVQHRRDRATGEDRTSRIALRYSDDDHNRRLVAEAGLAIAAVHGDWYGAPVTPASRELIYVCERS